MRRRPAKNCWTEGVKSGYKSSHKFNFFTSDRGPEEYPPPPVQVVSGVQMLPSPPVLPKVSALRLHCQQFCAEYWPGPGRDYPLLPLSRLCFGDILGSAVQMQPFHEERKSGRSIAGSKAEVFAVTDLSASSVLPSPLTLQAILNCVPEPYVEREEIKRGKIWPHV